jgi:BirA family biotin operon repressor/biotin-[acetyl-CoA-carboxylase] ligase
MSSDPATGRAWDVRWFAEVDSTNRVAAGLAQELVADGLADGIVVVADHQTAGRGRLDRRWEAPPGTSLLVSVVVDPAPALAPLSIGLASSHACEDVAGVRPLLKWPNDLVVEGAKLAGILGERIGNGAGAAAVMGVGINVNWAGTAPPDGGSALDRLTGHPVDRLALLAALLRHLDWSRPDVDVLARYRRRSATLGQAVRVQLGDEVVEGIAVDVTVHGHLLLDTGRVVAAGDVVHVRLDQGSKR